MRQADRTLIAAVGFSDPDKKDPRHDAVCQWMALHAKDVYEYVFPDSFLGESKFEIELERVIVKGDGQYRSHIGFIDVSMKARNFVRACFEVKIRFSLNEVLRQIKMYRMYAPGAWILVTWDDISDDHRTLLKNEGIRHYSARTLGYPCDGLLSDL